MGENMHDAYALRALTNQINHLEYAPSDWLEAL